MPTRAQEPTFNLKVVVNETGLKPDTLRAWERRYGLPQPKRTAGGHRLYSRRDIDVLKWLTARQQEGLSISRAVDLWRQYEAEGQTPLALAGEQPAPPAQFTSFSELEGEDSAITELREAWISACLGYDESKAERILTQAFAMYPPELVCIEILVRGLTDIGSGWINGEVTVQQEHFASALAIRRIEALLVAAPLPTRNGHRILVCCPPHEEHVFGLLLATLLLRRQGWDVLYLGSNVPLERFEATLASTKTYLVISAAQRLPTAATLMEMAQLMQGKQVSLAFGGHIFEQVPLLHTRIPGHFLEEPLDSIANAVGQLITAPPPLPQVSPVSEVYSKALSHYRERQSLIEVNVGRLAQKADLPHRFLSDANMEMSTNIIAALMLGDMAFLGDDLFWLEGLLVTHHLPKVVIARYLDVFQQALINRLDERGEPVTSWLGQLVTSLEQ